ncbi:unnamed protein product, partial [Musa acuminata subsp. burmannicoides]
VLGVDKERVLGALRLRVRYSSPAIVSLPLGIRVVESARRHSSLTRLWASTRPTTGSLATVSRNLVE